MFIVLKQFLIHNNLRWVVNLDLSTQQKNKYISIYIFMCYSAESSINGFLIGGASQEAKKFIDIIKKTYN